MRSQPVGKLLLSMPREAAPHPSFRAGAYNTAPDTNTSVIGYRNHCHSRQNLLLAERRSSTSPGADHQVGAWNADNLPNKRKEFPMNSYLHQSTRQRNQHCACGALTEQRARRCRKCNARALWRRHAEGVGRRTSRQLATCLFSEASVAPQSELPGAGPRAKIRLRRQDAPSHPHASGRRVARRCPRADNPADRIGHGL